MSTSMPAPVVIGSVAQLQSCVEQWRTRDAVTVDTEFMRTDTFHPILGLVQLYDDSDCWLIDPLAIEDLTPLKALFTDSSVTKVFHSCSEDLEVLQHVLGCIPQPLFDTQIAAAITGYGFSRGYAALVGEIVGLELPKQETRSDWLRRPLSDAQLGYAAEDVYHLMPIYRQLCESLSALERQSWMAEEMSALVAKSTAVLSYDQYYTKVKGAWSLAPQGLAILQRLCAWREQEARQRNRPRGRIIKDKMLLDIAATKPVANHELAGIKEMHPRIQRHYGDRLLAIVSEAASLVDHQCPDSLPHPLPRQAGDLIKSLKQLVQNKAEALNISQEMVARKRDIEELVRSVYDGGAPQLPASLAQGWRYQLVGEALLQRCTSWREVNR